LAAEFGFKVIFPLFGDLSYLISLSEADHERYLSWQIDEVGNHPALLMWTLGNELPLNANNSALVATLNQRIQFARNYTLYKWNRFIPITVAVVDDPTSYHILESGMN